MSAPGTDHASFVLGEAVDPTPGGAVERHLVAVAGEEVLAEILAELLEEVAQPADHRVVAQHAVLLLRDVAHEEEHEDADEPERDERPDPVRQDVFRHCPPGVFP